MAIFNKNDAESGQTSETTIIATNAHIKGELILESMLHVDGLIEGNIQSKSMVMIGKKGRISGDVSAEKLVVRGCFEGNADCISVEILSGGVFNGNVVSKELTIEAQAKFEGNSSIKKADSNLLQHQSINIQQIKPMPKL